MEYEQGKKKQKHITCHKYDEQEHSCCGLISVILSHTMKLPKRNPKYKKITEKVTQTNPVKALTVSYIVLRNCKLQIENM